MKDSKGNVVLGLDPGSRCTGVGIIREQSGSLELLFAGTVRPASGLDLSERLGQIFSQTGEIIDRFSPRQAAVEDVFTAYNASSALKLGQARGAVIVACVSRKIPVHSYEPTKVKLSLVGEGRASKDQVAFMVGQLLGKKPDWAQDASDALGVAIAHLNQQRLFRLGVK
ncbi:MAG: crossover junction endodeoxyribonuclease RuvC [Thermodesulfobacteriota bacterium]